jgi:hypothetical protein
MNTQYSDDESFYDPEPHDEIVEEELDEDPELMASRFVRPRDRQVDKRAGMARVRKAASRDYR